MYRLSLKRFVLVEDLSDLTRTYRTTTFTDSETETYVDSNSVDKFYSNLYVITRHAKEYIGTQKAGLLLDTASEEEDGKPVPTGIVLLDDGAFASVPLEFIRKETTAN